MEILYSTELFFYSCCVTVLLFFQVSVFLFWGTSFFEVVQKLDKNLAMITVGLISVTAPVLGVLSGGYY